MSDIDLDKVICSLKELAGTLGYPVNPGFSDPRPDFDFGRDIEYGPFEFWTQYDAFVSRMDGFSIDGFSVYGMKNYQNEHNSLFEYNNELKRVDAFTEGAADALIFIGGTGTDVFVYDTITSRWEVRDRIAINELYETYPALTEMLYGVASRICEINDL